MSGETTTVNKKTVTRLDAYERRYRALAAQLADIAQRPPMTPADARDVLCIPSA